MTRIDAKTLLTWLWGLFPNAPKLSADDRQAMAYSYWELLKEFSADDVMAATRKCLKEKPSFVPTAPEILKNCRISNDYIWSFLPSEYYETLDAYNRLSVDSFFYENDLELEIVCLERWLLHKEKDSEYSRLSEILKKDKEKLMLERKMHEIFNESEKKAIASYHSEQDRLIQIDKRCLALC